MKTRLPSSLRIPAHRPYSVLLQAGLAVPALSPAQRCALTAPFHPYSPKRAVYSLWRFPSARPLLDPPAGRYPAPCLHGARTFLGEPRLNAAIRPSGKEDVRARRRKVKPAAAFRLMRLQRWKWSRNSFARPSGSIDCRSQSTGRRDHVLVSTRINWSELR